MERFSLLLLLALPAVMGMVNPKYVSTKAIDNNGYEDSEIYGPPVPYNFKYNHEDSFGNMQHREENRNDDGVVRGSYGYRDPLGMYRHVSYVADANGFHAVLRTNEPGVDNRNSADVAVVAQRPSIVHRKRSRYVSPLSEEE